MMRSTAVRALPKSAHVVQRQGSLPFDWTVTQLESLAQASLRTTLYEVAD